jgi:hypothetical protein
MAELVADSETSECSYTVTKLCKTSHIRVTQSLGFVPKFKSFRASSPKSCDTEPRPQMA